MNGEETHISPLEFVCSECGRKVKRDSYTYFGEIYAPDESKKCPTCGYVPWGHFYYCSSECYAKGAIKHNIGADRQRRLMRIREIIGKWIEGLPPEKQGLYWSQEERARRIEQIVCYYIDKERTIEKLMTQEGVDRETAKRIIKEAGVEKKEREKPTFHKEFPKLAKKLGFRVYKQGFPDYLIEKEGKYVAVEVKERSELTARQQLMHDALKKAGLKIIVVRPDTDLNKAFDEARNLELQTRQNRNPYKLP